MARPVVAGEGPTVVVVVELVEVVVVTTNVVEAGEAVTTNVVEAGEAVTINVGVAEAEAAAAEAAAAEVTPTWMNLTIEPGIKHRSSRK